jgi:hypothetical protein
MFINKIIHNFKHIAMGIKPREQKFVGVSLKETIKQRTGESRANVKIGNTVFERGFMEQVIGEHNSSIPQKEVVANV